MSIVFFDTETTGFRDEDRVIQTGAILDHGDGELLIFDELCNRSIVENIPFESMEVHNITNEDLQVKGVDLYADTEFSKMIEAHNTADHYLIAHNIKFDLGMLAKEGFTPQYTIIDTLRVAKHIYAGTPHRLQYLRYSLGLYREIPFAEERYGIKAEAHSAIGDVLLLKIFVDHLIKEGYDLNKMVELTRTPVLITKFTFGKHKGQEISEVADRDRSYLHWMKNNIADLDEDMLYTLNHYLQ
ncbi:MAG: 3'-5' exonuclease [Clostridia bacterium]|nr:3'-5' exonuclease [Clostridia bacterium]